MRQTRRWALFTISACLLMSASWGDEAPAVASAPRPTPSAVTLPAVEGAWLVVVTQSGGLGGLHLRYSINSRGEGSTQATGDEPRMISTDSLAAVETQVRAAQSQTWVNGGADMCCDLVHVAINLSVRQTNGAVLNRSLGWTLVPPSSPSNAIALANAVESALRGR
jgi:hypothetical protein